MRIMNGLMSVDTFFPRENYENWAFRFHHSRQPWKIMRGPVNYDLEVNYPAK